MKRKKYSHRNAAPTYRLAAALACGILLALPAPSPAQEPAPAGNSAEDLSLGLARVQLYIRKGEYDRALTLTQQLRASYPESAQLRSAEAEIYFQMGNRRKGAELMDEAERLAPGNEDIQQRKRAAMASERSFVSVDREVRDTSDLALEQFTRVVGNVRYSPNITAGVSAENNRIRTAPVTRPNGTVARFKDDKQRGEITLGYDYTDGDRAEASLYAAEDTLGAGGRYTWRDSRGKTMVEADIQRPYWEYIEAVVSNGAQDRLRVSRQHRLSPRFTLDAGAAVNRYSLEDANNAASSWAVDATLAYTLPYFALVDMMGEDAAFTISYSLDAEYPMDVEGRRTAGGVFFEPLPLESHEIHALNLWFRKEITSRFYFVGYGGYAIDRLGDSTPSLGTALSYGFTEHFHVELRASRYLSAERASQETDAVGLNLTWEW